MKVLIVEDGGFDSWTFGKAAIATFPERLKKALGKKGYEDVEITVKTEWNAQDGVLLPIFDVVVSDLYFPTDCQLSEEEIKGLATKRKRELLEVLDQVKDAKSSQGYRYFLPIKIEDLLQGEIGSFVEDSKSAGFYVIGTQAESQGRKITFYTDDLGHTYVTLPIAILKGLITPGEIRNVITADLRDKGFRASDDGRLIVGAKRVFDNWVKALEVAIKSQATS